MTTTFAVFAIMFVAFGAVAGVFGALRPSALRAVLYRRAAGDFATFVELVGRDERTGAPLRLNRLQRRMISHWEKYPRSVTLAHPEFGKTSIAALYIVWNLGRDPTKRIVVASLTAGQYEKVIRAAASYIETSAEVAAVFPTLKPGHVWRSDALTVAGAPATMKDANVSGAAPGSGSVLGLRCDLLLIDDLLSRENTRTQDRRDELHRWYVSTLASRLAPHARIAACGTVWHRDDLLHTLVRAGFAVERFPILEDGRSTWPERWTDGRIAERRAELGPREFARAFMCNPVSDDAATFEEALVRGMINSGLSLPTTIYAKPSGPHYVGVDVAFSTGAKADKSALVVIRVSDEGVREIVYVESGRWDFDTLAARVIDVTNAFRAVAAIESNAGGAFLHAAVKKHAPAVGLPTTATNRLVRAEWLHAEASASRWRFRPADGRLSEGMRALVDGLLAYSPNDHAADEVSALFVAIEAIRARESKPRGGVFTYERDSLGQFRFRAR